MNKLAFPLACALTVASADAANIVFVSFHGADNTPTAAAVTAGFTTAPDIGYTDLLTGAGHTVTRYLTRDNPEANVLNAADLVIISRSVPSGNYQLDAETTAWNGITAPTMILGAFITRGGTGGGSRLGYYVGETIVDSPSTPAVAMSLTAAVPSHPIFNGVTLDGSNSMPYTVPVNAPTGTNPQLGVSINTTALAGGGVVLATAAAGTTVGANGTLIAEWQAGATLATAGGAPDTLAGHRLVFLTGTRERGITSEASGIYDLTTEGGQLFLNAVNYMAVPEPSTYALLGLGAAALLARRRKK